jgi:hypothetical protein
LQLIALAPELFAPWSNRLWLRFVSHKILRLFLPFLLAGCLVGSLFAGGILTWMGVGQLVFWAMAVAAHVHGTRRLPWKALSGFLLLNAAVVLAWSKLLSKNRNVWSEASSQQ